MVADDRSAGPATAAARPTVAPRAATGGTRAARRAGFSDASRLTPTPTTTPTMAVRGLNTSPYEGMLAPTALNTASRPVASRAPMATPTMAATRPTDGRLEQGGEQHLSAGWRRGPGTGRTPWSAGRPGWRRC